MTVLTAVNADYEGGRSYAENPFGSVRDHDHCGWGDLPGAAGLTFLTLGYMIGVGMLLDGIGRIVNWYQMDRGTEQSGWVLVSAIISLTLGIILMGSDAMQLAMDAFIVYMAIAWLITLGILRIAHALRIRKMRNNIRDFQPDTPFGRNWWIALIFGILLIVFGIIGLFAPATIIETIGTLIGLSIIIAGANLIHFGISAWML